MELKLCNSCWDLNPQSLSWDHTRFQDLMKLRVLMSRDRKHSGRGTLVGKKWIHLERNILHDKVWSILEARAASGYRIVIFYRNGSFHGPSGRSIPAVWGEAVEISGNWATAHFFAFYGWPWNCLGTAGVSVSKVTFYSEHTLRLEVEWKSTRLPSWTKLVLTIMLCPMALSFV